MAKIVQILTRPSKEYSQDVADAQVRDLDSVIQKLNTTYQQELKDEVDAQNFFFKLMANSFVNAKVDLTSTDNTTLYTTPTANVALVKSILVSNDSGSGCNLDVTLTDSSGNVFSLFKTKTVASNTTTELLTHPLVVEESEILKVQASDANELHVIASILQIQPREVTT